MSPPESDGHDRSEKPVAGGGGLAARFTAAQLHRSAGDLSDVYRFNARNEGPATAFNLRGSAVDEAGARVTGSLLSRPSVRHGEAVPVYLEIERAASLKRDLRLLLSWRDSSGEHEAIVAAIDRVLPQATVRAATVRCAWCTKMQDGDKWVEATAAQTLADEGKSLWSHGICPECVVTFGPLHHDAN